MERVWAVSFGENERMELERVIMDDDAEAALGFVKKVIYPKVKEAEKPGSCFHDVEKPVDEVGRQVSKHKRLGTFD
ncbi:MAG TPA: hypothetical protein VIK15_00865 [Candidatus Anoxymicrobiaceae bacterium]|jgi:hypothetical protein